MHVQRTVIIHLHRFVDEVYLLIFIVQQFKNLRQHNRRSSNLPKAFKQIAETAVFV